MAKNIPEFVLLKIDEIELLNDNPREINEKEFKELCKDIKNDPNFLMQRPPLINLHDGRNICYAGNQRLKAAKANGMTEIHVWREKNVSKELQDERMMKDNLHRGEWNMDMLKNYDTSFLMNVGFDENFLRDLNKNYEIPAILTAEKKNAPPSLKIVFVDEKQLLLFESKLKRLLQEFKDVHYSVSQGEI